MNAISSIAGRQDLLGPDLGTAPTLAEQLNRLDEAAELGEYEYTVTWLAVSDRNGGGTTALWLNDDHPEAPARIMSGYCFDSQEARRRLRWEALNDHHAGRENFTTILERELLARGRFCDNRHAPRQEVFAVIRAFLATGGRLLLRVESGKLETAGDMGRLFKSYSDDGDLSPEWCAGRAMERMLRRWRARPTILRVVRALGKPVNGFLVLEMNNG